MGANPLHFRVTYLSNPATQLGSDAGPLAVTGRADTFETSFVAVDEIQAFRQIDALYLARFYFLLWALLGACILGVLSSRFSFIVPLVFYNRFIDEPLWEYRFVVMTVQVMT